MSRRACIIFFEFGIVVILAIFFNAKGYAQDQRLAQLRKGYQNCVYDAVASEIRAGQTNNVSAVVELAFQSCATEEQAIRAHASAASVSPVDANQAITGFKLSLKQTVREIIARAQRDVSQQSSTPPDSTPPRSGCSGSYKRYDGATVYTNCR